MANKSIGYLTFNFGANMEGFDKAMKKAQKSVGKFGKKMKSIGSSMTMSITMPLLAVGAGAVKLASDFAESLNKVRVSFGDSSKVVEDFAKTTLESFGIAEGSTLQMASLFGDMGTSLGLTQEEAAVMSTTLVGLAGDLASFKDIEHDVAQTALAGIFTGETESLKKMGILITETTLKNSEYFKSLDKTWTSLTNVEKIQIRYNEILRQTTNAQGDYIETSEGFANQMRGLQETLKETGAELGQELIPLATDLVGVLTDLTSKVNELTDENRKSLVKWSGVATLLGPLIFAFGTLLTTMVSLSKIIPKVWSAIAGPVGIAVTLAALYIEMDKSKQISERFADGWKSIKGWITGSTKAFNDFKKSGALDFSNQNRDALVDPNAMLNSMMGGTFKMPGGKTLPNGQKEKTVTPTVTPDPVKKLETQIQLIERLPPVLLDTGRAWRTYYEDIEESSTMADGAQERFQNRVMLFGDIMATSMTRALNSQENFFESFVDGMKKAIKQLLIQLAVLTIIKALLGYDTTTFSTAFAAAQGQLGLQDGGLVTGPTSALIGEGPGTSASNPEVVAPLDKLKSMIGEGTQQVEVFGRLSGNDIWLSNSKTGITRNRAL